MMVVELLTLIVPAWDVVPLVAMGNGFLGCIDKHVTVGHV